mmetsp:Transcript_26340/g.86531  ORF Transcript_26340/g.86531 Transcript_26340/m.86531 type:complete len:336 (+) Transcript_26340:279-1286(+)
MWFQRMFDDRKMKYALIAGGMVAGASIYMHWRRMSQTTPTIQEIQDEGDESEIKILDEGQIQTQDMACKDNQLVVGKNGLRWWYEGKQGKHKQVNTGNDQEKEIVDLSMSAAKDGDLETLKAIASQGLWKPELCDKYGGTPLHWAAGMGRLDACKLLLQMKADPLARLFRGGGKGRTPMHYAARNGHLEVCKYFIHDCGVDPGIQTHDGTTPIHLAIWKGHIQVCDFLSNYDIDLSHKNGYGCDCSHWLGMGGQQNCATWLLGKGFSLTTQNEVGHTCLHKAAQHGHRALCEYLIEKLGITKGSLLPDSEGKYPSNLAREQGYEDLAFWLQAVIE